MAQSLDHEPPRDFMHVIDGTERGSRALRDFMHATDGEDSNLCHTSGQVELRPLHREQDGVKGRSAFQFWKFWIA